MSVVVVTELATMSQGKVFGEAFSLDLVGLSDLPADTAVPGVAVFSRRAVPLAAWTRCLLRLSSNCQMVSIH